MSHAVNHPRHYTEHPSGVECIAITEHMNFCLGNAVKYIWRAGLKGDAVEDLEKARWYLDREINRLKSLTAYAALAVAPFAPDAYGGMMDADGDRVITCNDGCPPCTLYKENMVEADGWFICPQCGRLGQRMEEASHRQVAEFEKKSTA